MEEQRQQGRLSATCKTEHLMGKKWDRIISKPLEKGPPKRGEETRKKRGLSDYFGQTIRKAVPYAMLSLSQLNRKNRHVIKDRLFDVRLHKRENMFG